MKLFVLSFFLIFLFNSVEVRAKDWWENFQKVINQRDEKAFMSYLHSLTKNQLLLLGEKYCKEYIKSEEDLEATFLVSPILSQYVTACKGKPDPDIFYNIIVNSENNPFWRLSIIRWLGEKYPNSEVLNFFQILDIKQQSRFISVFLSLLSKKTENELLQLQIMDTVKKILNSSSSKHNYAPSINQQFLKEETEKYIEILKSFLETGTVKERILKKSAGQLGRFARSNPALEKFLFDVFKNRKKYPKKVQYTIAYHLVKMKEVAIMPELEDMLEEETEKSYKKQIQRFIKELKNIKK
mgnify:CR=1 FL=1